MMTTKMPTWMRPEVTLRTSTTKRNVSSLHLFQEVPKLIDVALKEDDAHAALKAFRAVVTDQPEKGEWHVPAAQALPVPIADKTGASRR